MKLSTGLSYRSFLSMLRFTLQRPSSLKRKAVYPIVDAPLRDLVTNDLSVGCAVGKGNSPEELSLAGNTFNSITPENAFKWGHQVDDAGKHDFTQADEWVAFAQLHNLNLRGHTLVWGRTPGGGYPIRLHEELQTMVDPAAYLRKEIREHIESTLNHFQGKVYEWDVVNEPMDVFGPELAQYPFYQVMGEDYITHSFRVAQQTDPSIKFVLNEQFFAYRDQRAKNFLALVRRLLDQNVRIDTIGIQSHLMFNEPDIDDFAWFLQQVKQMGLSVSITELDIRLSLFRRAKNPLQAQANAYHQIVSTALSAGNCTGITIWGISDTHTWLDHIPPMNMKAFQPNDPLLFNKQLHPKLAYHAVAQAIEEGNQE